MKAILNVQGQRLSLACEIARLHTNRTELTEGSGSGQYDSIGDRRPSRREGDVAEGLPQGGPERQGCLLLLDSQLLQHRHDLPHDERQRDEDRRQDDPRRCKDHGKPLRDQPASDPAIPSINDDQRQAHHHGGDRERQTDARGEQ